jgi:ATP-binding protein involved in chromosome partitioning
MPHLSRAGFEQKLREFVLPQTGRALGAAGSSLKIDDSETGMVIHIEVGFPLSRSAHALESAIRAELAELPQEPAPEFRISWKVQAHGVQQGLKPLPGVSNIIAVASGKGGVGKSTVACNIGLALALEGARVGLLDADIYGPSLPRLLGLSGQKPETRDGKMLDPLEKFGVKAMSIGFLIDDKQPMAWRGPMVTSALNQLLAQTAWGELDYLVIDMPPGTGDIQLTLSQRVPVSGAVIVTTPQEISLSDARKGLEMFQKVNVPILGIVENMAVHICSSCGQQDQIFGAEGGRRLSADYDVPLLGALPLEGRICTHSDGGTPTVIADPDGDTAGLFAKLALRVAGELAAGARDFSHLFPKITVEED